MALVKIQVRRDTAATWAASNPVLAVGEPGLETDTGKIKYGDGIRNWNTLPYSSGVSLGSTAPPAAGAAAAGTSDQAARADHSHALPSELAATSIATTEGVSVGGTLTVKGALVGGSHKHFASDITNLTAAVFSQLVASIKAGANVTATVDEAKQTITLAGTPTTDASPLVITQDPVSTVSQDSTATFSARASGGSGVVGFQWQVSTDKGLAWSDVADATGAVLVLTGLTGENDGALYRLKASAGSQAVYSRPATLSIPNITITAQPPDATVNVGQLVQLAVAATSGNYPVSYQWQQRANENTAWRDIANATSNSYSFAPSSPTGAAGEQYRAVALALGRSAFSRVATVVVNAPSMSFVTQPSDTLDSGGAATFTASVTGGVEPLTYEWQRLGGGSGTWAASDAYAAIPSGTSGVTGQDAPTLQLSSQGASQHLRSYRLKVTDDTGYSITSAPAVLRTLSLQITQQPVAVSAADGATLAASAFSVSATADGGVTYQWQRSTNAGGTWVDIAGATSADYGSIAVSFADDGALYRAAVTGDGQTLFTSPARLSVSPPPLAITTQPTDSTASSSGTASFVFAYAGGPTGTVTIYWESRAPGGQWVRVAGATSTTLSLTGLTSASNGTRYRAVVQKGIALAATNEATLTVPGVTIITQPSSLTVTDGGAATFTFLYQTVACVTPTVQWQSFAVGVSSSWSNISGATSTTYTKNPVTTADTNVRYRAQVSCGGTVYGTTAEALLTVTAPPLRFTTQPADATASLGQASFSIAFAGGSGASVTIRWERAVPGGTWETIAGVTGTTLTVTGATAALSGAQYRAVLTQGAEVIISRAAVLTVTGARITLQPADTVALNGTATMRFDFTSTACTSPTIGWEKKRFNETVWYAIGGQTSTTLSLSGLVAADSGWNYRAFVTCDSTTSYTSAATLTVPSYEFFLSQPQTQNADVGDTVTFSYSGLFPASAYPARWQTRRVGATQWTYLTPAGQSEQSISFVADPLAHHNTQYRVEIAFPSDKLYSAIATLTVNKATSILSVSPGHDLVGVAHAKGAYVALTNDQTALARRSADGGKTWQLVFLPQARYWDGIVGTSNGALLAYSSGDSGEMALHVSPVEWRYTNLAPPTTGQILRSTDGGATWASLSLPFFLGSRARMFSLPYQNAVVLFFRDASATWTPSAAALANAGTPASTTANRQAFGAGPQRWGRYRMAVSTNDGTSWNVYEMPTVGTQVVASGYPAVPNAMCPDVTSAAISPSGVLCLTSRYQGYTYGVVSALSPGLMNAPGGSLFHGWYMASMGILPPALTTARYTQWDVTGDWEGSGLMLYRNVGSSGWGPPAVSATATIGIGGSGLRKVLPPPTLFRYPWRMGA